MNFGVLRVLNDDRVALLVKVSVLTLTRQYGNYFYSLEGDLGIKIVWVT